MKTATLLLAPIAFLVAPAGAAAKPNIAIARLGETVRVQNMRITPLRVLEDSRCPQNARCVWAGRVRLSARIGRTTRELTLGQPVSIAGGTLQLSAVLPEKTTRESAIPPRSYRFGFEFRRGGETTLIRY